MDLSHKNILVVRLGKIGDIIISSSVFEILKERYPGIRITLLTLKRNNPALKYNPKIDHKIFVSGNLSLFFSLIKLRRINFDLLLDLNDDPSNTSIIIRRIVKSKLSLGFDFKSPNKPSIAIAQPPKTKTHIIDRIKVLLEGIDVQLEEKELKPVLYLGENEESEVVRQLTTGKENRIIAVNISAGAPTRIWNEEKYSELIKSIAINKLWRIVILHSKNDFKKAKRLQANIENDRVIPMQYHSFQHFAAYIRNAALLITPDTSAVHIASAFNVPVIAMYPGVKWNFVSWQPLSEIKISLLSKTESLNGISVRELISAFDKIKYEIDVV